MMDPQFLREAFRDADEVYHLGGKLGTTELDDSIRNAVELNVIGAVNVFEAAVEARVPTVFYPTKPNIWLNTYTVTKVAAEQFAAIFNERFPIRIRSLRYYNAYGPGQATGPVRKIIPTFAMQALGRRPLEVYGDGEQTVDMIYSADIGRITVDFTRSNHEGPAADCGRGIHLTVNEVAQAVNDVVGNPAGIRHLPMRRGEVEGTRLAADLSALRRALPDLAFSDWMETLASTIEWYAARQPVAAPA